MVSLCGGLGAVARFVVDTLIKRVSTGFFPWSTLFINTLAGFLFAACVIYLRSYDLNMYVLATSGFLGGFHNPITRLNNRCCARYELFAAAPHRNNRGMFWPVNLSNRFAHSRAIEFDRQRD